MRLQAVQEDRGASAVEFALVVPLLLLIVFGIINFGVVFSQQLTLNNAVRAGARAGVVVGELLDCPTIRQRVRGDLSALGMNTSAVQVRITLVTASGTTVTTPCGGSYLATTDTSTGSGTYPCASSAIGTSLVVEGRYASGIPISFPPFPTTLTLNSKGVFVCEFH
ncbi:MAG TPA: TadE/TadG family type IV pilus assembly protein [Candidatus Nanopelagicales bacterium]|nr:TadE/TadG family type IV pilus assembly protein [Candidatus Nanopelagicales bacterium]